MKTDALSARPEFHRSESALDEARLDVSTSPLQSCWPTPQQELLLRATLQQGQAALADWEEWKSEIDIENLDEGSTRVLPLLFRNLKNQDISDPLMSRFTSVHRYFWYRNQMLFSRGAVLLKRFEEAGIETMVLKGAPLIELYYKDKGLRPMNDFDILVPTAQSRRAFNLLWEWGWDPLLSPHQDFNGEFLNFIHAHAFVKDAELSLDLHRHLLGSFNSDDDDKPFWDGSMPLEVGGAKTRTLNATDLLLHVCIHGVRWQSISPLRWITDAMCILQTSEETAAKLAAGETSPIVVDWDRLIAHAKRERLNLPLHDGVKYLRDSLKAPIPQSAIDGLNALPATRSERVEHEATMRPPHSLSPTFKLWMRYRAFLKWEQSVGFKAAVFRFPHYLKYTWELEDIRQIPLTAIRKCRRQLNQRKNWKQATASAGDE